MTDFDLSKITGRESPLLTDDDKDVEIEQLRSALTEAQASINFWMAAKDRAEQSITADAAWFRWLMADADRCAGIVADAYNDWDTDTSWEMTLKTEIDHRYFSVNQEGQQK